MGKGKAKHNEVDRRMAAEEGTARSKGRARRFSSLLVVSKTEIPQKASQGVSSGRSTRGYECWALAGQGRLPCGETKQAFCPVAVGCLVQRAFKL